MRPEGPKKIFLRPPPLSQGLDDCSPPLSESLDPPLASYTAMLFIASYCGTWKKIERLQPYLRSLLTNYPSNLYLLMSGRCQRIIIDPSCLFWVPYKVRFNENTVTGPTSLVLVLFWEDWRVYLFLKVEQRYSSFASFPQLFEDSNEVLVRPRIELGSTATQSCIQTSSISCFSYEKVNFNVKNLC